MADDRNLSRLSLLKRAAWLVILIERLWSALWPAAMVLALFVAASLFGLWQALPGWLHAIGLAGFALAFAAALVLGLRSLRQDTGPSALARLEADSGVSAHSLDSLDDRLSGGGDDALTQALWQRENARAVALIEDDPNVQALRQTFDAQVRIDSITPTD